MQVRSKPQWIAIVFILIVIWQQSGNAQYDCSTPYIISALPFSSSGLYTTNLESHQVSGICNTNYEERDYIFKYTPEVEGDLNIEIETTSYTDKAGIYIFSDCGSAATECIAFEESMNGTVDISFQVDLLQDYYIYIGTENADNFDITITKTLISGIAINKPEATQTLDVNGAVRISEHSTTPYKGTIQWNNASGNFEGYNGTEWVVLSNMPEPIPSINLGYPTDITGTSKIASDGANNDKFGNSVSISGSHAIIGAEDHSTGGNYAQGKAYIFRLNGNTWIEQAKLTASDGESGDSFGSSVSISGDYAVVGAHHHDTNGNSSQGKVYIYKRNGDAWQEESQVTASDGATEDYYGKSVSISGDYIIVGAESHDTNGNINQGKAYVYRRTGTTWMEEAILVSSDGQTADKFGNSVSITENYAIIGAKFHDTNGNIHQGKAYVYKRTGTTWSEEAILVSSDGKAADQFGSSVSLFGDFAIIGSPLHQIGSNPAQGKAYIFRREGNTWIEEAILFSEDGDSNDLFGLNVYGSGINVAISATGHDTNGNVNQGKVCIYKREGNTWVRDVSLISSDGEPQDKFGSSISISDNRVIVGASAHDTNGYQDSGKVYFY